jgi:mono/diheme cytochrome c family protein
MMTFALLMGLSLFAAPFSDKELSAVFYADLGPEEIDVSSYPVEQQKNYRLFLSACSQCHTPARAINSPVASKESWRSYVSEMRMHDKFSGSSELSEEKARAVIDFLAYDGLRRKIEKRAEFDALSRRLQRRYWETIEERMRRLQEQPRPGR